MFANSASSSSSSSFTAAKNECFRNWSSPTNFQSILHRHSTREAEQLIIDYHTLPVDHDTQLQEDAWVKDQAGGGGRKWFRWRRGIKWPTIAMEHKFTRTVFKKWNTFPYAVNGVLLSHKAWVGCYCCVYWSVFQESEGFLSSWSERIPVVMKRFL